MSLTTSRFRSRNPARLLSALVVVAMATYFFVLPGLTVVRHVHDGALAGPGTPALAWAVHRALTPRIEAWARERVRSGRAAHVALHDVPTTEWPLFTAVFYLMATDALQASWDAGDRRSGEAPASYAAGALLAARDLVLDPAHHTWVRTHWGPGYLHRENVFFRALLIAGLTSYERLTHDGSSRALLLDEVETLSGDLDRSDRGLLNDYPGECYPIDVVAAIGFISRADAVLGTDHRAFIARSSRAFEGDMADALGLVPYRTSTDTYEQLQPSRGVGNSWVSLFAGDLWPDRAGDLYSRYDASFWQDHGWAAGFREYARGSQEPAWMTEVDAGPVLDGFGTAASAFGIAAARRNGRFDRAYALASEMIAVSWPLPDGTLLGPRSVSHATDAPFLGEASILYFLTVEPQAGLPITRGGGAPPLVYMALFAYFGGAALLLGVARRALYPRVGRDAGTAPSIEPGTAPASSTRLSGEEVLR